MKTAAYLSYPQNAVDIQNQKRVIFAFAQNRHLSVSHFIEITSGLPGHTTKADRLLEQLQPKDTLIVCSLSRLGGSVGEIVRVVDVLIDRCIRVIAVDENLDLCEKPDLPAPSISLIFRHLAKIDRELCSQRTKQGLKKAKAAGKKLGRPKGSLGPSKLDGKEKQIQKLMALGVSKASIAKITGVDRSTLYHFIRSRALA